MSPEDSKHSKVTGWQTKLTNYNNAKPCISWVSSAYGRKVAEKQGKGSGQYIQVCLFWIRRFPSSWWNFKLYASILFLWIAAHLVGTSHFDLDSAVALSARLLDSTPAFPFGHMVTSCFQTVPCMAWLILWLLINKMPIYVSNSQGVLRTWKPEEWRFRLWYKVPLFWVLLTPDCLESFLINQNPSLKHVGVWQV